MPQILVTSALPYANGPIHLGHLVEYLQTDMWVRFQKLRGNRCVYVCADDTHGTAIMIRARQEGLREEDLIARMQTAHLADFRGFQIEFDNYGSTNDPQTRACCEEIWRALRGAGLVAEREVTQLFDPVAGTFLADRFVKGTCPKCKAPEQYGDSCEKCLAHFGPADLIDPLSTLSGAKPELRSARHLFVNIERWHDFLAEWVTHSGALQPEVANYLKGHFLGEPLHDWDISRPAPYFGFEIPDCPGQYWYVWFDAPIGYLGSTRQWCDRHGEDFDRWWRSPQTEVHHFIGKDITYFHTLFWPAMLKTAGFSLPRKVHIHGFLTVNGEKMSKSKGTFIRAATYLEHLDPAYLRYYYAAKIGPGVDDLDLNFDELVTKVNADMVGNVVNLAARTAKFAERTGLAAEYPADGGLFEAAARDGQAVAEAYQAGDFARGVRVILAAGDRANRFVEASAPWNLRAPGQADDLRRVCTIGLNLFRQLAVYLAPVLPKMADQTGQLLGDPITAWDQSQRPLVGRPVAKFQHLMQRVDRKKVENMVAASAEPDTPQPETTAPQDSDAPLLAEPLSPEITIDEFTKADLRVCRVLAAEEVPDARKLLKLTISLGGNHCRTVFAGIKGYYRPDQLVGRLLVCVANLAPRKMKFGLSEGMILAAGGEGDVHLLLPDEGARPGQRVH
ncbi:MAG: methionine--tRNA ligase [Thermoguttaceae bacterium]|jgi:methionyl-tRNA synthetase